MTLSTGTRLGPYEILSPLGAGGMGEVYRARDTRLGRDVAIKVLPANFAQDADRLARFEREAQVLANLNHHNIASIYGLESGLESSALVMELVEGPTLAERIGAGPIALDEALPMARQIAAALEYAHERGIVHRDLKPANIKLTSDGAVKVLDFGLAKALEESPASGGLANSPTLSLAATKAGMILGTAGYMAPEQAKGAVVDKRADIWAFGVVFYEMLSGKRLIDEPTASEALAAVLKSDLNLGALPVGIPPRIRRLIERCLQRDPKVRLRDIGEARIVIDAPEEPAPSVAMAGASTPALAAWKPMAIITIIAALCLVGVAATGWYRATRPAPLRSLMRLDVEVGTDAAMSRSGNLGLLALSPDGTRLAVTLRGADGKVRLGTRFLHQGVITPLAATEGAGSPFFSPDGQSIGFFADGKLKKISVEGGAAVTLCDVASLRGASWGDDGNIIFAAGVATGLSRVSSAGGLPAPVTKLAQGERTHRWPQVLPGSQAVLFTAHTGGGDYNEASIDVVSLKTGERKTVQRGGFSGRYLPSGHLVYLHQSTLFAARFDLERLALTGAPVPILEDAGSNSSAGGDFDFSQTGALVYRSGREQNTGWLISWLDSTGKRQPLQTTPGAYYWLRLSHDGKRLAFSWASGQGNDIWVKDLDRDTPSRLSFLPGLNNSPIWTPDDHNIVFRSLNPSAPGLYLVRSDGSGEARRLTDGKFDAIPYSISPDGKRLAYTQDGAGGLPDIWTAPIEGDPAHPPSPPRLGQGERFVATPFAEVSPVFSPDGRWLAYASQESGTIEVYVRPFPGPGGRWEISAGGGVLPRWSRSGRELLFVTLDRRIMAVDYIAKGDSFAAGKPRVWSETRILDLGPNTSYDLAPDGKRVAALMGSEETVGQKPLTHLTLLLNFFDELQRRVPAGK